MYKKYLENEQLNFQVNRFLEDYYDDKNVQQSVVKTCKEISNLEDWYEQWFSLGNAENQKQNYGLASLYYQLSEFYLPESDHRKKEAYGRFKSTFYKSISEVPIEHTTVPYNGGQLPVAIINNDDNNPWLVFHGGFDSYLEELIRLSIVYLSDLKEYNILMFEGPGQGQPSKDGLYLTHEWEKPVSAILDYFDLDEVALVGMSLGGYLALRAAAKEKRIKKVIAFDTFYSMDDAFFMNAPKELEKLSNNLEDKKSRVLLDQTINSIAEKNIDLQFKINKAKEILGKDSPSEIISEIKKYSLEGIENLITQDTLLLAGTEDMYVPTYRTPFIQNKLINVEKVETAIFNKKSGGQYHCQVGNKKLAFKKILDFLSE